MIRTSLHGRSARGRAADTAARPPTRTKSSISVVTNNTFKQRPRARPCVHRCKNGSNFHRELQCAVGPSVPEQGKRFPVEAAQIRVTPNQKIKSRVRPRELWRMTISGTDERNLTGSFAGLRVLDFSTTIAGPHCTRMLADMGAEVIKIETEEGETMRTRPPVRNNCSTAFGQLNVGKNSLVLDLKSPK